MTKEKPLWTPARRDASVSASVQRFARRERLRCKTICPSSTTTSVLIAVTAPQPVLAEAFGQDIKNSINNDGSAAATIVAAALPDASASFFLQCNTSLKDHKKKQNCHLRNLSLSFIVILLYHRLKTHFILFPHNKKAQ